MNEINNIKEIEILTYTKNKGFPKRKFTLKENEKKYVELLKNEKYIFFTWKIK